MAFLFYFVVILVSAASVMFGLDLMTSPLPSTPNVPIGRSAQVAPAPAAKSARATASRNDDRGLSPIYPASPKVPNAPAKAAQPATADAASAKQPANDEWLPPQDQAAAPPDGKAVSTSPPQQQATTAAPPNDEQPPAPTNPAAAASQPAVAQSSAHCDVQACAAAYRSFRASDCSYQPFGRARQVCSRWGGAASVAARPLRSKAAYAVRPWRRPPVMRPAEDHHELDEVTRIVRRMTRGEDGDVAVRDSRGRIIVVRPGGARAYSPFDGYDDGD